MTDEEMRAPLTPGSARVWASTFGQLAEELRYAGTFAGVY